MSRVGFTVDYFDSHLWLIGTNKIMQILMMIDGVFWEWKLTILFVRMIETAA